MSIIVTNVSNLFDEEDRMIRNIQTYYQLFSVLIYSGLLTTYYLPHLIIRSIFYMAGMISVVIAKNEFEENKPIFGIAFAIAGLLLLETIVYIVLKNKAKLFVSLKLSGLQQKQLFNLMDTVPDKVLICSPVPEGGVAKGIYSNQKMNEFFGRNMGEQMSIKPAD